MKNKIITNLKEVLFGKRKELRAGNSAGSKGVFYINKQDKRHAETNQIDD